MEHIYLCPHCQSTDLHKVEWQIPDNDQLEEVDALECQQCYAGAPLSAWQNNKGWIPVSEQLPAPVTSVLVFVKSDDFDEEGMADLAEYTNREEFVLVGMEKPIARNLVTHWMALPGEPDGQ